MFEKEAEEYANEKCKDCYMCSYSECKNPYEVCEKRQCRKQAYKDGAEFGYNKANEWHYVKDKLPKENKKYWVLTSNGEPKVDSWLTVSWVYSYDVIAWKEIVPPSLDKEKSNA